MDQYIKNILPRLQSFSKNLNKKELFVDKSWILFNEPFNRIEYTFCRDKTLIKSVNGIAHQGSWKLLSTGKLIITIEGTSFQLEKMFLNEGAFILHYSGDINSGLIFFNERIVKNNLRSYLESLEKKVVEEEKLQEAWIVKQKADDEKFEANFIPRLLYIFFGIILIVVIFGIIKDL